MLRERLFDGTGEPSALLPADRSDQTKYVRVKLFELPKTFWGKLADQKAQLTSNWQLIKFTLQHLLYVNNLWLFLALLSIIAGLSGAFNDISVQYVNRCKYIALSLS